MNAQSPITVTCNGRDYRFPLKPTVVVCIDGSEPGYIEAAIAKGLAPHFDRLMKTGASVFAKSVIPSFTNPNNMSIITGRPPAVHGIAGNYFYDRAAGAEVMMNDAKFLRAPTIMKAFHDAGARVAVVTAKDKLRALLCKELPMNDGRAIGFSSEKADAVNMETNGIADVMGMVGMPLPSVYSADLSEFVMASGVKLLERFKPDLMYLSTTDYVQHKAGPGAPMADSFYAMMDKYVGQLDALGCNLVLTADHGMNDKHLANGEPDVIYLQDVTDGWYGAGATRVILPITDPYVVHHGALGSFATVYLHKPLDRHELIQKIAALPGVEAAMTSEEACQRFELPADRIGDVVVVSTQHKVLGTSRSKHDLSGLTEPLRSHGGITEQRVPLISNRKLNLIPGHDLRNFDAFDVALNRVMV